ncbi:MAG TPA: amidohydrolase family protein [Bacteroidota bacterium]
MTERYAGRHYDTGEPVELYVEDGRIAAVGLPTGAAARRASTRWLTPSLVDIQVNGFGGWDLNAHDTSPAHVQGTTRTLWSAGVSHYCPTVTTGSRPRMLGSLRAIAEACRQDPETARAVLGIHLEGPYISPEDGPRGAHPRADVRPPDWDEFQAMQEAAGGRIRMVTLAPELPGAISFIEKLSTEGIVVALGHLAADSKQIAAAVAAGARISTHLGNGAHALLPRHPNYLWDQLACDELWMSIIPDGHHLPPAVVKSFVRAKGVDRTVLVSDAIFVAGLAPGEYSLMDQRMELTAGGRVQLSGTPYLAGSALQLAEGVGNVVSFANVSLREAIQMSTLNPRRVLGLAETGHDLTVGAMADLLILREDPATGRLQLEVTVVNGEPVFDGQEGYGIR